MNNLTMNGRSCDKKKNAFDWLIALTNGSTRSSLG